ncbi:hypothetical protein [Litoreibacter albidus]|uniref:Invasion protein IalB, involved in pathogenesis n=1 Tax=Litoreibacter albidus TaxID=670155 RepID=A0A1H2XX86_9RHOB|nr:hypothetical protein [Litoreibacter albidus]SDW96969.1 hypothetical protein SAMN04488001_2123 [Litoreibacter albidus]
MKLSRLLAPPLLAAGLATSASATEGERIQITGEVIDTWCYFSGVMGGPDAVVGSAHHTCALWCSAGGIPVGLLAEDGEVYMVLKINGDDQNASGDTNLNLASHEITADGMLYKRDGLNYLVVEEVITDHGITNLNHEDYGVVPGFAIPEPKP